MQISCEIEQMCKNGTEFVDKSELTQQIESRKEAGIFQLCRPALLPCLSSKSQSSSQQQPTSHEASVRSQVQNRPVRKSVRLKSGVGRPSSSSLSSVVVGGGSVVVVVAVVVVDEDLVVVTVVAFSVAVVSEVEVTSSPPSLERAI